MLGFSVQTNATPRPGWAGMDARDWGDAPKLTPSFWDRGYFKQLEIKCGQFAYSLELPPGTTSVYCFLIFTRIFMLFTNFSNAMLLPR